MKSSDERRIQNQFGCFCTRVLKNEARHVYWEYDKLRRYEKSLDELTPDELRQTARKDSYFVDDHVFDVQGLPIVVSSDLLAQAIAWLPKEKRDIILLAYFQKMSDREIGEFLHLVRQTVWKRRLGSLKALNDYLTKEGIEWRDV